MSKQLDSDSVSNNNNTEFINISISWARIKNNPWAKAIPDISTSVKDFAGCNPDKISRVSRVIFSCGTNYIEHNCSKNIGPLTGPMPNCDLVVLARKLFGQHVEISFQSVIPMRIQYNYTVENFLNFNRLLQCVCSRFK